MTATPPTGFCNGINQKSLELTGITNVQARKQQWNNGVNNNKQKKTITVTQR